MARRPGEAIGPVATFSIIALDRTTGDLGVAVASKYFAVGSVVAWAKVGVGAVATQAWVNPRYGVEGLARLEDGIGPEETLSALLGEDRARELRQVGMIDAPGRIAQHTGGETPRWAGHRAGEAQGCVYAAQGNTIAGPEVLEAMIRAARQTVGPLAERLMVALEAGQAAGGDRRGGQSASLLVVRDPTVMRPVPGAQKHPIYATLSGGDRYVDLRVDDHEQPIAELRRLWELWKEWWG